MADSREIESPRRFLEMKLFWEFQPVRLALSSGPPESGPIRAFTEQRAKSEKDNYESLQDKTRLPCGRP